MPEYHPRATFTECHHDVFVGGGDERSMGMYQLMVYEADQADRQRRAAWAEEHAWRVDRWEQERRRKRREAVARVLRALAAWFAPVDAEANVAHGGFSVEGRA
jgi:hypothetical protein